MQSRWNQHDEQPGTDDGPLAECTYGSRLLGAESSLVLHGGGNTSVKGTTTDVTGATVETIWVKGSGWDLATIEPAGFAPLRLERLRELLTVDTLSDPQMVNELRCALVDASAPNPSVESLLHAFLPFAAVQHSHADVIVTLTNQPDGADRVREVFGERVLIVPYVMPGFDLAKACYEVWQQQARPDIEGMVLLNHGLFTFADTTREAYERHIELISEAEAYLDRLAPIPDDDELNAAVNGAVNGAADTDAGATSVEPGSGSIDPLRVASLRRRISEAAGRPMVTRRFDDAAVRRFVNRPDVADITQRGTLTPDHVLFIKPWPMIGTDVDAYIAKYSEYFQRNASRADEPLTMLDPAPRVVLDETLGMVTVGGTARMTGVADDIYRHTMQALERAEELGSFTTISDADLFDVEYWDLEQAKLRRAGPPPSLAGQVALVTGAASGIGRACAEVLLGQGAAVVGWDLNAEVASTFAGPAWLGQAVDVTDTELMRSSLASAVDRFGGIDIVVVAAGIFPSSSHLAELDGGAFRRTLEVNISSVADLFSLTHPFLVEAPAGGRVVVIGSKNVAAPGPGAAAYSASKAALNQLARVAALEWAGDDIRVNTVHPDAVFDTGLWTAEILEQRAARYDMSVDEYKRRNLLSAEITSLDVARLVVTMVGDAFSKTTGAQVPIDGGNERVI